MPTTKHSIYMTPKEIGVVLNNAVAAAFNCKEIATQPPLRAKQIRNFTAAILDVVLDYRKKEYLTAEELVAVFTTAALFVHVLLVAKGGALKLQMYQDQAKRMLEDTDNDNPWTPKEPHEGK